jgi:hypothetical protein
LAILVADLMLVQAILDVQLIPKVRVRIVAIMNRDKFFAITAMSD